MTEYKDNNQRFEHLTAKLVKLTANREKDFEEALKDIAEWFNKQPLSVLRNHEEPVDLYRAQGYLSAVKEFSGIIKTIKSYKDSTTAAAAKHH